MREHAVAFGTDFRTSVLAGNGNARGCDAGVRFDEDCGILWRRVEGLVGLGRFRRGSWWVWGMRRVKISCDGSGVWFGCFFRVVLVSILRIGLF